jgi:Cof subfamily protein (haloacid dehalogenase superfamily)
MELVVFDLDGTLLNRDAVLSPRTAETLRLLADRGIAYTVATGRMLHGSREVLQGHGFRLPHILKNGVMTWDPASGDYQRVSLLTPSEIRHVVDAVMTQQITPFIVTLEPGNRHAIYHAPPQNPVEERLVGYYRDQGGFAVRSAAELPAEARITNISAIGERTRIERIVQLVDAEEHLVAYAGNALEGDHLGWIDIHHSDASKGGAVLQLKQDLGARRVICFGDSDNDLSMFAMADECYAPANAKSVVKAAATAVIGHHDEDGIADFLRERFKL